jgi:hypothetical protein
MDSVKEIKKTWSVREKAPKFAAALILLAMTVFTKLKDGLVQLYQIIFTHLNRFLPLPI